MRLLIISITLLSFDTVGLAQSFSKKIYYQKEFPGDQKIFNRMDVYPNYKGYSDKLNQFLVNQINIDKVMNSLPENTRLLGDIPILLREDGRTIETVFIAAVEWFSFQYLCYQTYIIMYMVNQGSNGIKRVNLGGSLLPAYAS